jgi:hypothetical protein
MDEDPSYATTAIEVTALFLIRRPNSTFQLLTFCRTNQLSTGSAQGSSKLMLEYIKEQESMQALL